MIAASEPHEYTPRGRQQVEIHPGPLEPINKKEQSSDDFILNGIERVCLEENDSEEWWTLRQAPAEYTQQTKQPENNKNVKKDRGSHNFTNNKSKFTHYSDFLEESASFKTLDNTQNRSKRVSDSSPRFPNKRISQGNELKNETTISCDTNKSYYAYAQYLETSNFSTKVNQEYVEDELYIKGHTAVWSRGIVNHTNNSNNGHKVICCYTVPLPIKQALWCTFYCERPMFDETLADLPGKLDDPTGVPVPSLCLVDSHNLRVFVTKGEQFVIPMSFPVKKVWHTKFGILIEKGIESNFEETSYHEPETTLFSLAYPLDDICPVAVSHNNTLTRMTNSRLKIVFTSETPSICILYDSTTKQHSVYLIRKVKFDERDYTDKIYTTMHSGMSSSNKLKSRLNVWDNVMSSNHVVTPNTGSKPSTIDKLTQHLQKSRSFSSMAAMSRGQSPAVSTQESPWMVHTSRKDIHRSFPMEKETCPTSKSFFDCSKSMSHVRSNPQICLEYLWTDTYSLQETVGAGPASKAFLTEDLIGQWYLCYILTSRYQLTIIKIDFTCASNITFGVSTSIGAKDAAPIPHLKMLAILEYNGNVTLYSGLTVVGKLHIGGTLAQHTPSPFIKKKIFVSPFPRRSSLLPQYKQSEPKFEEHILSAGLPSPICPSNMKTPLQIRRVPDFSPYNTSDDKKISLTSLIDPIENRLTLKYSDGSYYRITIPILASSNLVESCIIALRQCLPRDTAMIVMSRWYAARNVLGAQDINTDEEWDMFAGLIFELLGYEEEQAVEAPETPFSGVKRLKQSLNGCDEDWNFMINSERNAVADDLNRILHLDLTREVPDQSSSNNSIKVEINPRSLLFNYIRLIHFTFHLLYEDLKLNALRLKDLQPLMKFLNKLSNDLNLPEYSVHYWKDFPDIAEVKSTVVLPENVFKQAIVWSGIGNKPISVMQHICDLLDGKEVAPYPYLGNVNARSRDIIQICGVLAESNRNIHSEIFAESFVNDLCNPTDLLSQSQITQVNKSIILDGSTIEQVVLLMVDMKIDTRYIETLPMGVYFLLYNALWMCREKPPSDWPIEAYRLLWRDDLVAQTQKVEMEKNKLFQDKMNICFQLQESMPSTKPEILDLDGMEDIDSKLTKMLFREDIRVLEAKKMLASSKPVPITIVQRPDVSDHDFIEEQEKHLYGLCIRTMALPVGRGMFTLRTATPIITEPLAAPVLCLTGKAPPRGATVELSHIDTPANMNLWPLFHNGVANGLRITPDAQNIDNTWIVFNKPKSGVEPQMEHAGFLMALGLNGHLKNLAVMNTFDYLGKLHEMTSVGILLGLSAAFKSTCNQSMTKMLAIHIEALLPPTSMEIDVPQNLQVAGLLGIGLVYQRSAHRHITEVLLSEIGRPPGPEMENSVDRESYSLAAGLALGLVMLKHGGQPAGMSDLNVPDTLHYYMVGGAKRMLTGSQKDKYKTPSFQIREGSSVNLDVTAPGATLALGMIYLGTGNKAVADWMAPPATQYLLDFVRPDFLMLRVLSRSLILWNEIEPSKDWIMAQIPSTILPYCMVTPSDELDIDYEAMNQAYCNIVTGACFALGLKFAGTANQDAFETLLFYCHIFTSMTGKSIADLAGKATIETCLNLLLISAAMVMAGTGNLEVMRLVRHLRRRVGLANSAIVTYGSHLAIHMALGLLFLGGGRYTLSNSPESIAALICAFYPKFPTHSNDNRYHLQAFRHLYVLAVEPRLVIPKDVLSNDICYAHLQLVNLQGAKIEIKAPGLIPDLNTLRKVVVKDERYWPVVFEKGRNWDLLVKILSTTGYIEVKQRAGCLSYMTDKFGYHSELARTLTHSKVVPWDPSASSIVSFTSDECIRKFCAHILGSLEKTIGSAFENKLTQMLTQVMYDAVVKDKLIVIIPLVSLIKSILDMDPYPNTFHIWQLKLVLKQVLSKCHKPNLVSKETMLSFTQEVRGIFDKWEHKLKVGLQKYIAGEDFNNKELSFVEMQAAYIVFHDLPYKFYNVQDGDLLENIIKMENSKISSETMSKVLKVFE